MNNPLLESFKNNHQSAPFSEIKEEHFLPAFVQLIKDSELEIQEIVENPLEPTFENTIEALAFSGEKLDVVSHLFFNLISAETNEELQNLAQEISPLLSAFSSKISQNEKLFVEFLPFALPKRKLHSFDNPIVLLFFVLK